jgi:hypothetical protein
VTATTTVTVARDVPECAVPSVGPSSETWTGSPRHEWVTGKSVEAAVSPGRHSVRARMDWHESPTIEVDVPPWRDGDRADQVPVLLDTQVLGEATPQSRLSL